MLVYTWIIIQMKTLIVLDNCSTCDKKTWANIIYVCLSTVYSLHHSALSTLQFTPINKQVSVMESGCGRCVTVLSESSSNRYWLQT